MPAIRGWVAIIIALLISAGIRAQDTLHLSLPEAERLFLQKNFLLLAAKFQVSEADAAIIQAKLYPNPNFTFEQGVYNPDTKKVFDFSSTGETALTLQQVIILAGKRSKQVNIAKINSQLGLPVLRPGSKLRYELRSSFYALYFLSEPISVYDREIGSLNTLIDAYTDQYHKGNIAFKDLARLQALQFSLQNERLDLLKQVAEKQLNLSLLTGDTLMKPIQPLVEAGLMDRFDVGKLNYLQMIDSALQNRYDLKAANAEVQFSEANLALQKAMRVPDLMVGGYYDKAGNYVPHYNALTLAIDLPFWNRNQGNIKAAEFQIGQNKQLQSQAQLQVRDDITKAYRQLLETDKLYRTAAPQFTEDYEKLLDGIIKSYQNHTISLLEFIDYYETYKNSKLELNRLQNNRFDALENLNLATGTTILN